MRLLLFVLLSVAAYGQVPANGTWVAASAHGAPGQVFAYDKTSFVDSIKAHCVWGGYKMGMTSERNDALVCYSFKENRWHIMARSGSHHTENMPGQGHAVGVQFYIPADDSLFFMADGSGSNSQELFFGHWWQWDFAGFTMRDRSVTGTAARPWAPSTSLGSSAYDPTQGKALYGPDPNGNFWVWTRSTNTWAQTTNIGKPPNVAFPAMTYNADDGLVYIFGGNVGANTADIYTFNLSTGAYAGPLVTTCTGGTCSGNKPPVRQAAFFAYSTVDHKFLMGGGVTTFAGSAFTDTWYFDPSTRVWTLQSPAASYLNAPQQPTFERCQYDPDSNVFVLLSMQGSTVGSPAYADGTWTAYYAKPYYYAMSTALSAGRLASTYTPTSGSLNLITPTATSNTSLGSQSYAKSPTLALNGTTIYMGDTQTLDYFDTTTYGATFHPEVQSTPNNGIWTNLGTPGVQAIATNASGVNDGAHDIKLAYVNSTLWLAATWWNGSGALEAQSYAKTWNGSIWSGGVVGCFTSGGCGLNLATQWTEQLIAVGTTPTIAAPEFDRAHGRNINLWISQYNGATWASVGAAKINNVTTLASRADGATLAAVNSTNFYACWNEELIDTNTFSTVTTNAQIFCRLWNGSVWGSVITGANLNRTSTSWAGRPTATYVGGVLYVAWAERSSTGNPLLYCVSWNGSSITLLGGAALNIDAGGWAARPWIYSDGTDIYLSWLEQSALGAHSLGHTKKWNGSAWSTVGGAFAADTSNGSLQDLNCLIVGTSPTCSFSEIKFGNLPQTYVRQYNGTSWTATLGSVGPTISTTSPLPVGNRTAAYSQSITATSTPASLTCTVTAGTLPTGLTLNNGTGSCLLTGVPTTVQMASFTVNVSNGVNPDATRAYSLTINDICLNTKSALSQGTINIAYSDTVTSSGCVSPVFTLTGSVPSGVSQNSSTGVISGTPTVPGNYFLNSIITDSNGNSTTPLVLVVGPPPQPKGTSAGSVTSGLVK